MNILGINDAHDSGVALVVDGEIKNIINEERLSRIKLNYGFPENSINKVLEINSLKSKDIDYILVASKFQDFIPKNMSDKEYITNSRVRYFAWIMSKSSILFGVLFKTNLWMNIQKNIFKFVYRKREDDLKKFLRGKGFVCPIRFIEHHLAHAACAYYTSGKENALVITSDASGDAISTTVSIGKENRLKRIKELGAYNSIGKFYNYVTVLCGFTIGRHEGKVTGLSAYGKPIYLNNFKKMIIYKNGNLFNNFNTKHKAAIDKMRKKVGRFKRENLAASVQIHLEREFKKFVEYWMGKTKKKNIVLAGGLFSNVKLNQIIHEIENVEYINIHPHMGDGGIALGAILAFLKPKPFFVDHVYFGVDYSDEEIEKVLKREKLNYKHLDSIEKEVALLLSKGRIVARFDGKMEYGPREVI